MHVNQSLLGQDVFRVAAFLLDAGVKTSSPLPDCRGSMSRRDVNKATEYKAKAKAKAKATNISPRPGQGQGQKQIPKAKAKANALLLLLHSAY